MDDLTTTRGNGSATALPSIAVAWTQAQIDLIKSKCVPVGEQPSNDDFAVFLHTCQRTQLDPLLREAWLIKRSAKDARGNWVDSWQTLVGRDGYLAAAQRTGEFRGIQTHVYPEDASKPPTHATCEVWRAGWPQPVNVSVAFAEYVQMTRDGRPTRFWADKPRTMIGKVAQAQALRLAFSLHGTYSPEEMPDDASAMPSTTVALPMAAPGPALAGARVVDAPAEPEPVPAQLVRSVPEPATPLPQADPTAPTRAAVFARMNAAGWSQDEMKEFVHRIIGTSERKGQHTVAEWRAVHRALDEAIATPAESAELDREFDREPGSRG